VIGLSLLLSIYLTIPRSEQKLKKVAREIVRGKQLKLFQEEEELSKYGYSCLVTSFSTPAVDVWRSYRKRAGDENIIKENTHGFGLEGFSLDSFYSTEAAMLIRILFYNISPVTLKLRLD